MILKSEEMKIAEYEEEYEQVLADWERQLPLRKRVRCPPELLLPSSRTHQSHPFASSSSSTAPHHPHLHPDQARDLAQGQSLSVSLPVGPSPFALSMPAEPTHTSPVRFRFSDSLYSRLSLH